ncbi:hypothetical protein ACIRQT_00650 [Streptomyces californicus]|uniref:hypothetical protein n=1 Tax=Streptomyces californicus TaxID=67351 RepID=UPI0038274A61
MHWIARQHFNRISTLLQMWGAVLLLGACALWARLAFLLVDGDASCSGETQYCDLIDNLPEQLTLLAASSPLSVLGTALLVAGTVRRQASGHALAVIELRASEDRAQQKSR